MRVFAKDVSGQKLDRGFESRPLRLNGRPTCLVESFPGRSRSSIGSLIGSRTRGVGQADRHRVTAFVATPQHTA